MPGTPYTLQILHGSDFEAGLLAASGTAKNFAAVVDKLEDLVPNSITLSSGDNFIPGPFNAAETDPALRAPLQNAYASILGVPAGSLTGLREAQARVDVAILNAIGVQASAVGNHDFDFGPTPLGDAVSLVKASGTSPTTVSSIGAQFPYLSANLDFTGEPALASRYTAELRDASTYTVTAATLNDPAALNAAAAGDRGFAPWTVVTENGERIGVIGLTTQLERSITSLGGVTVKDPAGDGGVDNTTELAQIAQGYADQLTALGIDKIVVVSHLQQYQLELDLATKLRGVDVIVAGGSHSVFANPGNVLPPGQPVAQPYPVIRNGADGNPVAVVNVGNEYTDVGRLVVTFDANGVIDPNSIDRTVSGAYATTDAEVRALWGSADPFAPGTRGGIVKSLTDPVSSIITAKDGNVFGYTDVYLEGRRTAVRTQETNLGDLSADANLYVGKQFDPAVAVSFKNGGGIRAEIGSYGLGADAPPLPPAANPAAGKLAGGVSQLDIENSLRFNNALSVLGVTAQNLARVFEFSAALAVPGQTPGGFGQVGGVAFSYDPTRQAQVLGASGAVATAGQRVRNLAVLNPDGSVADTIVRDGVLQGDPSRAIRIVTLSFIADGGDGNPLNFYTIPGSRTDLLNNPALPDGVATFAAKGSEQDAMAEFMCAAFGDALRPYGQPETGAVGDGRIQDLTVRADTVLQRRQDAPAGGGTLQGDQRSDRLVGGAGDDTFIATAGRDTLSGNGGNDLVRFMGLGRGNGALLADSTASPTSGFGWVDAGGSYNATRFDGMRRVEFADGRIEYDPGSVGVVVQRLYRGLLGREGDVPGVSGHVRSTERGVALGTVADVMAGGTEGSAKLAGLTNAAFVQRLYQQVLGRTGEASGAAGWLDQLDRGLLSRGAVALRFAQGDEARLDAVGAASRGQVVADLDAVEAGQAYRGLLGRDIEASSVTNTVAAFRAGLTAADVARSIASSPEFARTYNGLTDAQYVAALYRNVLGRDSAADPSSGGNVQYLGSGGSRAEVAAAVFASSENQAGVFTAAQDGIRVI